MVDGEVLFSIRDASYAYPGGGEAICRLSFEICYGEAVAILGANGSGKSTLLRLLDGLIFPTSGVIAAMGTDLTERSIRREPFAARFRQSVGFLFQNPDVQLFNPTVREELAFGPLQLGLPSEEIERRTADKAHLLGIEKLLDRSPAHLSSGEKKLVALASLLTCEPCVLLMDEPSAGLDPRNQRWLMEFLKEIHSEGTTLIIASHDLSFVFEVAERALVLSEDHRLAADGPILDVLGDLNLLLGANLIHEHTHRHGDRFHAHLHSHVKEHEHEHFP